MSLPFFIGYLLLCGIRTEHLKTQFVSGKGSSWFWYDLRIFLLWLLKSFFFSSSFLVFIFPFYIRAQLTCSKIHLLSPQFCESGQILSCHNISITFPKKLYKQDQQAHCIWDSSTLLPLPVSHPLSYGVLFHCTDIMFIHYIVDEHWFFFILQRNPF